jgi:hypothetical protein
MKPFKKIAAVILLALACCFLLGGIADKGYHRFYRPFFDKLDISLKDTTHYNVVFLGNSTVHFGINPFYVDSITKVKTFNLGYAGANIESITALFYGYLSAHPKPDAIVLSIESNMLREDNDYAAYFLFFNYLDNKSIRNYLENKGYHLGLPGVFPFLKYSYFDDYNRTCIVQGFSKSPMENKAVVYKGFINNLPGIFRPDAMDTTEIKANELPDKKGLAALCTLLNYCQQQHIKVLFVFPPRIYATKNGDVSGTEQTDTLVQHIALRYQMPYERFNVPGLFRLDEFSDMGHLNNNGATHYSICVGQYIDSVLH